MNSFIAALIGMTPDKVDAYMTALEHFLAIAMIVSGTLGHVVAIFGSPKAGEDANKLQKLLKALTDGLAANYGKASNKP